MSRATFFGWKMNEEEIKLKRRAPGSEAGSCNGWLWAKPHEEEGILLPILC